MRRHQGGRILIIGQYIDQLNAQLARQLGVPLITGKTPNAEREKLYGPSAIRRAGGPDRLEGGQLRGRFARGQRRHPDLGHLRLAPAQRLGRILRPKADGAAAVFYSVVTLGSRDQEFAEKRQLFLTEQGYAYEIVAAEQLMTSKEEAAE